MTVTPIESEPLCAKSVVDPDIFYSHDPEDTAKAQSICAECPLKFACLESALNSQERWGVWGGATQNQLRVAQSIDDEGEVKNYGSGFPTSCLNCGKDSTKYLYVIEKKKSGTRIACSNCGLEWITKKLINKAQNNF